MITNIKRQGIIAVNFAGGGGADVGIEQALGRHTDIAINHDAAALAMHKANNPKTKHFCEDVNDFDIVKGCEGRVVDVAWFSPDCTHFSKAKGGLPVKKEIRGLAWVVLKWASLVKPTLIFLENVEEFVTWCPLDKSNRPDKKRKGETFNLWKSHLEALGYEVEFGVYHAHHYGASTSRKRFFLIARNDGLPIKIPKITHGTRHDLFNRDLLPYKTAGDIIDWDEPVHSIFMSKKDVKSEGLRIKRPLADKTLARIAKGIQKFVTEDKNAFIVRIGQTGWGGNNRQYSLNQPLTTITTKNEHLLVRAFLTKFYGTAIGQSLNEPLHTITRSPKFGLVNAFLIKYYGAGVGQTLNDPLHTITGNDRFGLIVTIKGQDYQISDIKMRMLTHKELYRAQGFPDSTNFDVSINGKKLTKTKLVHMCGNSVPPALARAIVSENAPDYMKSNIETSFSKGYA